MESLKVTIAICTWNRCQQLKLTLESMVSMRKPGNVAWEILVVDNGSVDDTAKVVQMFKDDLPIRRIYENRPGLSNARNKSVENSSGDYIIFTDDDVLVDKEWLVEYCNAFQRWPNAMVLGGPIEPLFIGSPPRWILDLLGTVGYVYGRQNFGDAFVKLDETILSEGPYGGNMAFSRLALYKQCFDVSLGTKKDEYNIGEETKLIRSILASGAEGWWTPKAKIRHVIPPEAQRMHYIRRWMIGAGRHDEIIDRKNSVKVVGSLALYLSIVKEELAYFIKRPFLSPKRWIGHVIISSKARGRLVERKGFG